MDQTPMSGYTDWKGWEADRFAQCSRSDARYYAWHVVRALPGRNAPLRVLEVGYGNGSFLGWARGAGHEVAGVEVLPELLARARAAGIEVAESLEGLPTGAAYDLVVAFDVLEHIPTEALNAFVAALRARVAPGGALLLRVPNGDSPFGRRMQHGDLTHVNAFGVTKLEQLMRPAGLALAAQGEAPWRHRQGMSRTLTNLVRAASRAALEAWIRFAYAWSEVSLAPNLVVVFRAA